MSTVLRMLIRLISVNCARRQCNWIFVMRSTARFMLIFHKMWDKKRSFTDIVPILIDFASSLSSCRAIVADIGVGSGLIFPTDVSDICIISRNIWNWVMKVLWRYRNACTAEMFSKKLQNLDVNAKSSLGCCCFGGRRSQSPSGDEEEKIKLKGDNPKSRDKSKKKHRKSQQNVDGNICDPPKDHVDGGDITKQQDETKKTNGKNRALLYPRPGVMWLWHFLYGVDPRPYPALYVFVI